MMHEEPFPHFIQKGNEEIYKYSLSNWKTKALSPGERGDVIINDKVIHQYCKEIMGNLYHKFLPILQKEYPKWDFKEQKTVRFQFSTNYSHQSQYSSRDWHIDSGNKLLIGLWYFKDPNDDAGGNLQLTNKEDGKIKELTYDENVMIVFPNTLRSWHRVKERLPSKINRKFINMLVEQNTSLHSYTRDSKGNDEFKNVKNYYD